MQILFACHHDLVVVYLSIWINVHALLIGWVVSDLDFTNCKALLAELLRILLADGGGFKLDFFDGILDERK